jgi:AraC-like DNA-binding protein
VAVLEADSADGWESVVSGCFVPLRCAGFEPQFSGRMEHTAVDERLSVSLVTTCGTSAERTRRLAARAGGDDLHLSLQRSSVGTVSQNGRSARVRPGSVTVYATDQPYYLDYSRPEQQQLIVQVSRSSLGLTEGMVDAATHRLAVPDGLGAAATRGLFSYVAGLAESRNDDQREVGATIRDLAQVMLCASFEEKRMPRTAGGLRHTVKEFLRANATKPGIDMDHVARRHFVSRRRLYQVFEQAELSPAAFLRTERLAIAARMLEGAPLSGRTVEQIAYASGFEDLRTFTRAFRRAYGCTPREWRARAG